MRPTRRLRRNAGDRGLLVRFFRFLGSRVYPLRIRTLYTHSRNLQRNPWHAPTCFSARSTRRGCSDIAQSLVAPRWCAYYLFRGQSQATDPQKDEVCDEPFDFPVPFSLSRSPFPVFTSSSARHGQSALACYSSEHAQHTPLSRPASRMPASASASRRVEREGTQI